MYRVCTPYISKEGVYILLNTVPHAPKEGIPQYHMHQRDDTKGGGLYCMPQSTCTKGGDIPHYHMHQRDDTKEGGLYCTPQSTCTKGGDIPRYHMHQRDDTKGGGLYCMPQCHTVKTVVYMYTWCTTNRVYNLTKRCKAASLGVNLYDGCMWSTNGCGIIEV